VLRNFLDSFSPNFRGIPGTSEQLAKVWRDYGVQVLDGGETHSSFTYVIDRSGRQRLNFSPNTSAEDIAHDLKLLLAEK
jgi:cytochrome oxidase Cu insertion factor (SCO1/SenC/PrrC family)